MSRNNYPSDDDRIQINLSTLSAIIFYSKLNIFFCTLIFIIAGIIFLRTSEYKFDVKMEVIPVSSNSSNAASSVGGLARIVGLDFRSQSENSFEYYTSLINSYKMAKELSKNQVFMQKVFSNAWDNKTNSWKKPTLTFSQKVKIYIKKSIGLPTYPLQPPGIRELQLALSEIKVFTPYGSGVTYISYLTSNPKFGVYLLNTVDKLANDILKENALNKTQDYINFLNQQLSQVQTKGQREALLKTLVEQQRALMIASTNFPYVAEQFVAPYYYKIPTTPKAKNTLMFSALLGFFSSIILNIILYLLIKTKKGLL